MKILIIGGGEEEKEQWRQLLEEKECGDAAIRTIDQIPELDPQVPIEDVVQAFDLACDFLATRSDGALRDKRKWKQVFMKQAHMRIGRRKA